MKKFLFLIIFVSSGITSMGQIQLVEEVNATMSQGVNRGFKVLIPETDIKTTQKAWDRYIRDQGGKLERIRKATDMVAKDITITAVNDMPMDVYSIIKESPEGIYLTVFYYNGSAFINSDMHPVKANAAKTSLTTFASKLAVDALNNEIAAETKKLEKLEKEQAALQREHDNYVSDIADAESAIAKAQALIEKRNKDIEKNSSDQQSKIEELENQKATLQSVKEKLRNY